MNNYMRRVELIIDGMRFTFPELTIYFNVEYSNDEDTLNDADITIYNLSRETLNKIKEGSKVILNAGYVGDVGNVFVGVITDVSTKKERVDRVTKIIAVDASDQWIKRKVNRTYKAGIKASQILRDIAGISALLPGEIKLPKDVVYQNGRTVSGTIPNIVKQIAKDCGAAVKVTKNKLFIRDPKQGDNVNFLFNTERGLIGTPERFEDDDDKGYIIIALLNHRIQTDSVINVESSTANGKYKVRKAVFRVNRQDFFVEMEGVG